jgi:hypothetical protein
MTVIRLQLFRREYVDHLPKEDVVTPQTRCVSTTERTAQLPTYLAALDMGPGLPETQYPCSTSVLIGEHDPALARLVASGADPAFICAKTSDHVPDWREQRDVITVGCI